MSSGTKYIQRADADPRLLVLAGGRPNVTLQRDEWLTEIERAFKWPYLRSRVRDGCGGVGRALSSGDAATDPAVGMSGHRDGRRSGPEALSWSRPRGPRRRGFVSLAAE